MSIRLVFHSFALLFRNFAYALRVSAGPLILAFLLGVAVFSVSGLSPQLIEMAFYTGRVPPTAILAILFIGVVMLFTFAWIAVAWHRFVLLEEYPGLIPAVTDRPIWPYVWRTLGLGVLLFVIILFLSVILGIVVPLMPSAALGLVAFLIGTVVTYVWLRSALILPAVAVGEDLTLRDAWTASAPQARAISGAAAILVALNLLVGLVQSAIVSPGPVGIGISLAVTWVTLMVGTSILTTLYGHLIQNRPLP